MLGNDHIAIDHVDCLGFDNDGHKP